MGQPVFHVEQPCCVAISSIAHLVRYLSANGKESVKQLVLMNIP
jgi:hypothetical protein